MEKGKWYKKISNWLIIFACVILIPILVFNLVIMYKANTNKDEIPGVFGYKPFIVLSGSMETKIHRGDLIITKEIEPETLKKDDVIAFRDAAGTVTTHRIIDIIDKDGEKLFVTKGDNNNAQDQNLVEYSDVEGIYIGRVPSIGSMMNTLAEPTTIVIIMFGITIAFGTGFVVSTKKKQAIEQAEFLEYKRMKELEENKKVEAKKTTTKKTSTKKETPKKKTSSK